MGKEADRFAHRLSATRPSNPVDIILGMTGKVVIDHVGDAFDIDSACGNVGGNQNTNPTSLKILERTKSLILRAIRMKSGAGDSQRFESSGNAIGPVFCTGKDENGLHGFIL